MGGSTAWCFYGLMAGDRSFEVVWLLVKYVKSVDLKKISVYISSWRLILLLASRVVVLLIKWWAF